MKYAFPGNVRFKNRQLTTRFALSFFFNHVNLKPEISVRTNGDGILTMLNISKTILAKRFRYVAIFKSREVERSSLRELRKIGHYNDTLFFKGARKTKYFGIVTLNEFNIATTKCY